MRIKNRMCMRINSYRRKMVKCMRVVCECKRATYEWRNKNASFISRLLWPRAQKGTFEHVGEFVDICESSHLTRWRNNYLPVSSSLSLSFSFSVSRFTVSISGRLQTLKDQYFGSGSHAACLSHMCTNSIRLADRLFNLTNCWQYSEW